MDITGFTHLFNNILEIKKMSEAWRKSTVVLIYKNGNDIQNCSNNHYIELIKHSMKSWEKVIKDRMRCEIKISGDEFGLCQDLLQTTKRQDLHKILINLQKYMIVPREILSFYILM